MGKFGKRTNASVYTRGKFSMGTNASVQLANALKETNAPPVHMGKFWKGTTASVPLEQSSLLQKGVACLHQAVHPEYRPVS
jgi:hypothetical protein